MSEEVTREVENPFFTFLNAIVPMMSSRVVEYSRILRTGSDKEIRELRTITLDAGRQLGRTTAIKDFFKKQSDEKTGVACLHINVSDFKLDYYPVDGRVANSSGGTHFSSPEAINKLITKIVDDRIELIAITSDIPWREVFYKALVEEYSKFPNRINPRFILIFDK